MGEFEDMLKAIQKALKQNVEPVEEEYIIIYKQTDEDFALTDTAESVTATGEKYYCEPDPGQDPIICGFWKAS